METQAGRGEGAGKFSGEGVNADEFFEVQSSKLKAQKKLQDPSSKGALAARLLLGT
jgi:hypothetical protein